jgi:hypothetical protein
METLSLDFNRLDTQGRVRIGPEAKEQLWPVLSKLLLGARVLVVDDDGSQCEGILEWDSNWQSGYVVRLDMTTWRDIEPLTPPAAVLATPAARRRPGSLPADDGP